MSHDNPLPPGSNTLAVLRLVLEELGVDLRKPYDVQHAIYLAQLTGVDLGYRFGWYPQHWESDG
jgi:hypothetical protein